MSARPALAPRLLLALLFAAPALPAQVSPAATPPRLRHRVHDLLAEIGRAEVAPNSVHAVTRHGTVSSTDPRPGVGFVRTRPGRWITFPDLLTRGPTTLSFAVGVFQPDEPRGDGPVRFLVDVNSDRDPTWRRVFDRTLRPSELPPDDLLEEHLLELPGVGALRRSVRLWALPVDDQQLDETWPAWNSPTLRSEGVPLPLEDDPVVLPDSGRELLAELAGARLGGGASATLRPMDPAPGVELLGGALPALRLDAPARITWRVEVPADGALALKLGVDARTSWHLGGGELDFAVQVDDRPVQIVHYDPGEHRLDRGWKELRVDLSAWAGRRVTLGLATSPGERPGPDVVAVARAVLVDGRGIPRLAQEQAPTVVLIVADTLRADAPGPSTPALTALARNGVNFRAARSVSSWTWPSTASLLTGLDPLEHRLLDANHPIMSPSVTTLAELFAQRGYTTGAFVANALVSEQAGLHRGFETFVLLPNARADTLDARVEAWLEETAGTARLLYVHYMDPHAPYLPAGPLDAARGPLLGHEALGAAMSSGLHLGLDHPDTRALVDALRAGYAQEVADLDRGLARLLGALERDGALRDALVVFVADHGEEFLEHGAINHGWHLFDETLAVPLTVTGFGASALEPRRVDVPVSTRDLLPTICDLLGIAAPAGRAPPWDLRSGEPLPASPIFGQTLIGRDHGVARSFEKACVIQDGHKLVLVPETGAVALYRLGDDPFEHVDRAAEDPARVARLLALLDAWRARGAPEAAPEVTDDALEEAQRVLREMGYLGR